MALNTNNNNTYNNKNNNNNKDSNNKNNNNNANNTNNKSQTPKLKLYSKLNKHINFKKEQDKSSARKTPTQVTCCKCRAIFILPFKPRNPEVYCDECFKKIKRR